MNDFRVLYSHVPADKITHRMCWNPNYPGRSTGIGQSRAVKIRRAVKPETRQRIKESISREGIRNPIVVYITENDIFLGFGGGRLQAAQELDIVLIPAICVDYTKKWIGKEVTPSNWQEFFIDVPKYFEFTEFGILTHYGLERGRKDEIDPAGLAWVTPDDVPTILKESPWLDADGFPKA